MLNFYNRFLHQTNHFLLSCFVMMPSIVRKTALVLPGPGGRTRARARARTSPPVHARQLCGPGCGLCGTGERPGLAALQTRGRGQPCSTPHHQASLII